MITRFLPFFLAYAEIHYHFPFLKPKYFKKEPEIVSDIPIRLVNKNNFSLPVLIIIKDAHLFPIKLLEIKVSVKSSNQSLNRKFEINEPINSSYYSRILHLELKIFEPEQFLKIVVEIKFENKKGIFSILNDNYQNLGTKYYRVYLTANKLPYPEHWYAGETHYHSNYTNDQVEFGADIPAVKIMAKAMGLNWLFVTDHSYDLDDTEDNYTKTDPELKKWLRMKAECSANSNQEFQIIPGEEVSIGNHKGKNVHLLLINEQEFITGSGDGAENWFSNKPTHNLSDLTKINKKINNLLIAAHPVDPIPLLQKLSLRRGYWHRKDYILNNIKHLQLINSADPIQLNKAVNYWRKFLLQGDRFSIIAGNDAHGNFNIMRQISIPFLKLYSSKNQCFGQYQTVFNYPKNDPVAGLKNNQVIVGNGPYLNFQLHKNNQIYKIGDEVNGGCYKIEIEKKTSVEFGSITDTRILIGNYTLSKEKDLSLDDSKGKLEFSDPGYIRMSMKTEKGGRVWTNPIWISTDE